MTMISVGIVGATGYTGVELLRLLAAHPQAKVTVVTSRAEAGRQVAELFPNLRGHYDMAYSEPDVETLAACNVVFFATPHAAAMHMVPELIARNTRVVDLSADFRLQDVALWEKWYNVEHSCPDLIPQAVYGLPEQNRAKIKTAQLVAVAGCYPTSVQLALKPLLEAGIIETSGIIADCKSGVSGAGRGAKVGSLFCEAGDNFMAYGVAGHRHLPEIEQGLSCMAGADVKLTFVPHLTPMIRGIHSTIYAQLTEEADLQSVFESCYADEPFVDVMPEGVFPQTRSVRGSNTCRLSVIRPQGGNTVVIMAVEDNLVKGASGQAIQCMNLMLGLDESTGLNLPALLP
jgi:N-acetyl-gamma-glutamyl-phosphate reductase